MLWSAPNASHWPLVMNVGSQTGRSTPLATVKFLMLSVLAWALIHPSILIADEVGAVYRLGTVEKEELLGVRDLLLRDFGLDLPISGALSDIGSRSNPVVIHSSNEDEILLTMYLVVDAMNRGLGRAISRREQSPMPVGVLWRPSQSPWLEYHAQEKLYSYRFERKEIRAKQISTTTLRYYFQILSESGGDVVLANPSNWPRANYLGFGLPKNIGWLHQDDEQTLDYATKDLGVGVAYGGVGIKATVYIYPVPSGQSENLHPFVKWRVLKTEFEDSAKDVERFETEISAWPDQNSGHGFFERAWSVGEDAREATVLGITIQDGYFIKYRTTWVRDHLLDQSALEFMSELQRIISN